MKLSSRNKSFTLPEYSLTGDILSFLTCNLQYRYQNMGALPPSKPVQLWFGEFIHGIMEEAYLHYEEGNKNFPWDWKKDIRPLEEIIDERLQVRGLYPPEDYFCPYKKGDKVNSYCKDNNHPHKLLYSIRAESAINIIGPYLFPLVSNAEVLLKGVRNMPNYSEGHSRSKYYSVNGIIDVLSSLKVEDEWDNPSNKIVEFLSKNEDFMDNLISLEGDEYEIIIDYKGMKRPPSDHMVWQRHDWQIQTYAWLREMQEDSKSVIGGIVFYLNELEPSEMDIELIQEDIINGKTDVKGFFEDENEIINWDPSKKFPNLSTEFKLDRCVRVIPIREDTTNLALAEFDKVVSNIEECTINEMNGRIIRESWTGNGEKRTCNGCDFKTFCSKYEDEDFSVP